MKHESQPAAGRRGSHPESSLCREARVEICQQAARACTERFGASLRSLVLTGSLAREEATIVPGPRAFQLLGDAEFLAVMQSGSRLPSHKPVWETARAVESALQARGIRCAVDLSPVHPAYFERLEPHIFAYELMNCGEVVCGDPSILHSIPSFGAKDILLEDAWRLLCNRFIELLESAEDLAGPGPLPLAAQYRVAKLFLDMATSLLIFAGAYEPTYAGRAEALRRLAANGSAERDLPFELSGFVERVAACTEWKLNKGDADPGLGPDSVDFAISCARLLWRWEMTRLTGSSGQVSKAMLLARWNSLQPLPRRLRGWIFVVRRCGWLRSIARWPRWASRAFRASPRHWTYAAATELMFRLPCMLRRGGEPASFDVDWEQLRQTLPVTRRRDPGDNSGWRQLASEIVWNYHEFLTGTRA